MKAKPDGSVLYHTFMEADRLRVKALEQGSSREAANGIVAAALSQAWPKSREEPWRFLCTECEDSGWRLSRCPGDASCGRHREHHAHDFAQSCWCAKGRSLKPKERVESDELAAIGKTRKPSRFGRE